MHRSTPPEPTTSGGRRTRLGVRAALAVALTAPLLVAAWPGTASAAAPTLTNYQQKKSAQFSVPPGSQVRATVTCPRGTNVVGGGALLAGSDSTQGLNTSNPDFDGRTWVVRVNSSADNFAQFSVYAICVAGIRNYRRIEGIGVDNPGGTQAAAQALCPSGTSVLGGGVNLTSPLTTSYINSSRPISGGWQATASNANPDDDDFVMPYAVCGTRPAGLQQVIGTPSTLRSNSQGQAVAGCPSGTRVLSGGAQSSSKSQSVSQNSSSPTTGRIWQVFENNIASTTSTLTTYAVCAPATTA